MALAVLGAAFSIAYATANTSLLRARNSQEHSEALQDIDSQLELLRAATSTASASSLTGSSAFCLDSTNDHVIGFSSSPASTAAGDDFTSYPPQCSDGRYYYNIQYNPSVVNGIQQDVYTATVRWDSVSGNGRQQETLKYKLHLLAVSGAPTGGGGGGLGGGGGGGPPTFGDCTQIQNYVASVPGSQYFNLWDYNGSDWHVWYKAPGHPSPHPISSTYYPLSVPAGTYWYYEVEKDLQVSANGSLHFILYTGSSPYTFVMDTQDIPGLDTSGGNNQSANGPIQTTFSSPLTAMQVEHAPFQPTSDDGVDSACFAVVPAS